MYIIVFFTCDADTGKTMNQFKHIPKDAQVIMSIIKDMGIVDYESKIINQLLEFTYRYITCILDDSRIYANHAKKKFIDLDDVRLAVKMQLERTFTNPPPRNVILDVAKIKNNIPLPFVKPNNGLRLPPERYCLNETNYKLKTSSQKYNGKGVNSFNCNNKSIGGSSRIKVNGGKNNLAIVKRPNVSATATKTQTVAIPKPVFKFSTNKSGADTPSGSMTKSKEHIGIIQSATVIKMETDKTLKRKRDEDDYDAP